MYLQANNTKLDFDRYHVSVTHKLSREDYRPMKLKKKNR